jgi:hypothetical protein
MMESAGYEIIKKEGFDEGPQQGLQQGMIDEAREAVLDVLLKRFGKCPAAVEKAILSMISMVTLKSLRRQAVRVESLDAFRTFLEGCLE